MKKLVPFILFCFYAIATCYAIESTTAIQETSTAAQDPAFIKTITLYSNINGSLQQNGEANLYKQPWGYGFRYFIQLKGTSIQLLVHPRDYNCPRGFNSWSVDQWGIYYYYNV